MPRWIDTPKVDKAKSETPPESSEDFLFVSPFVRKDGVHVKGHLRKKRSPKQTLQPETPIVPKSVLTPETEEPRHHVPVEVEVDDEVLGRGGNRGRKTPKQIRDKKIVDKTPLITIDYGQEDSGEEQVVPEEAPKIVKERGKKQKVPFIEEQPGDDNALGHPDFSLPSEDNEAVASELSWTPPKQETPQQVFICGRIFKGGKCGRFFKTKSEWNKHKECHENQKAKVVEICGCVTTSPGWYKKHLREGCNSTFGFPPPPPLELPSEVDEE